MRMLMGSILSQVGGSDRWLDKKLLEKWNLKPWKTVWNKDGSIDYDGNVTFINSDFTKIPIRFNKVNGYFDCSDCKNLISLEGCPKEVGGFFSCSSCENLLSLEGCPKEVDGWFSCVGCKKLTTIEGCPERVELDFYCYSCERKFTKEEVKEKCKVNRSIFL